MKNRRYFDALKISSAALAIGAALSSAPVFAQEAAEEASEQPAIVVTGSRIARPDLESSSPVSVVTSEQIQLSGTNNAEEYLRDLPQAVPAIGGNTNNGNPGVATLDLRNLGEERTLILVDGKRFVPFDSNGIVDLNMIPAALIERAEVLTGGASSVYGSDAVAGVVNFVMKKNFEGFEADAQYGITEKGDGQNRSFSITAGVNSEDGRGNLVVNATYVKVDAVTQGARDFSRDVLAAKDLGAGGGSSTVPEGVIDGLVAFGGRGIFDAAGNLAPFDIKKQGFNFNPFNLLLTPQNKWTATALARYEINDSIEFYGRSSFANSRVSTIIAPSGTFGFEFDLNYLTNPNLSAQAKAILAQNDVTAAGDTTPGDGNIKINFRRRTTELGTRNTVFENTAYQLVGGFRGDISESVKWETFAQWGRTSRTQSFENDLSFDAVQAGILDGSVNLFGPGKLSLEAGQKIRLDLQQIDATSQFVAGGFLTADLPFTLASDTPGGIVIGAEFRREKSIAKPDQNLIEGNSIGFGSSTPIDAQLTTKELYAELNVPIVTDKPFFHSFSLEAGIRHSDYTNLDKQIARGNNFKTTSFKVGGEWSPVEDLKIRGGFNRAVRAPNLNEIGQPFTPGTGDANFDHCESVDRGQPIVLSKDVVNNLNRGAAATELLNLCVATGVPLAALQAGLVDGIVAGQINNFSGGNINLTPEKADTFTIGAVFKPSFLRGFTASVDFYDINVKNAIFSVPEQEAIIACYEIEKKADGFFCSRIKRNPLNGSLSGGLDTGVDSSTVNIGGARNRGIDFAASYQFDIGEDTNLAFAVNATRTLKSTLDFGASVRECAGRLGGICLRPLPKLQWIQTSTLEHGPWTFQLRWQHIGKLTNDSVAFGLGGAVAEDFAVPVIGARDYFDLYGSVEVAKSLKFRAGINNLLDSLPPIVGNDFGGTTENSGNTYPGTYDPLGRSFFVGATLSF
ncbi:TonB-dependent receptor [Sphingorhabdus sp. IMCC26285]|uniref:TonB-dependent receptor n=1 Tax=Sphingorhabdus profundilacus TaxID=2509718 RepID=A0A6I4M5X1_9SPHN|nr:TonB-dependent receptor [Sphingorhabdus profundilacus]MVZ97575.1 TonB-dependent receptor [Sphingorhabdus profundilacus]